jgi:hypothetical protein
MWECQITDILPQFVVQQFNTMEGKFLVMHLGVDEPRLGPTSFRQIVIERRVENPDCLCFTPPKDTS